jgi:hypothetical protein
LEFLVSSLLYVLQGLLLLLLQLLLAAALEEESSSFQRPAADLLHSLSLKFGQQSASPTT